MNQPANPSNEALMARYQARLDAEAMEQIVSRFLAPAVGVAREFLRDPALAEDAVQEAFLRVVRHRGQYIAPMPFASWFYAILRNVCVDMLRRRARQARMVQEMAVRGRPRTADPPPDWLDVLDILNDLPEDARGVLTLRIVQDMPFRDIAAAMGISEEAAKKRAQRALRQLREQHADLVPSDAPETY